MEANEIICPQCGLANNELAESCVQCGIIFIKNPAMSTHAIQDDRKIKAIEEAETLLNDIPAPPEIGAFENDIIKGPDTHEDTAEMPIPKDEAANIKPEDAAPETPGSEKDKKPDSQEIEMEAIEAAMETVDGTRDPEALFLSKDNTDTSSKTVTPQTDTKTDDTPAGAEKADDQNDEILELKDVKDDSRNPGADALPANPPEENPIAEPRQEKNREKKEPADVQSETAEGDEAETAIAEVVEPEKSGDLSIPADAAAPAEPEVKSEETPESTAGEAAETKVEKPPFVNAAIEMPPELAETNTRADELPEKAQQDVLKKQKEAQAKAEALEKEKVARAVALKKKKLVQAQALKKQKAAQAKAEALKKKKEVLAKARALKKQEATKARAEALKKQKDAQAEAEAASQDVECACNGLQRAAAAKISHYERLLGLLKRYKGKAIGINYDNSSDIREAELVDANEEFFSVRVKDEKLQYSYPLKTILTIVEGQEGVEAGEGNKKAKFDAVIKVYPLVLS